MHLGAEEPSGYLAGRRRVVEAFLAAVRAGDMNALLAVLAPDVVRRVDPVLRSDGVPAEVRGARAVVEEARTLSGPAREAELTLVNGTPGAVVTEQGRLRLALTFLITHQKVVEFEVIADPERLDQLVIAP